MHKISIIIFLLFSFFCLSLQADTIENPIKTEKSSDSLWVAIKDFHFIEREKEIDLKISTDLFVKHLDSALVSTGWYKDTVSGDIAIMIAVSMDSLFTEIVEVKKRDFQRSKINDFLIKDIPLGKVFWLSIDVIGKHKSFKTSLYYPSNKTDVEDRLFYKYPIIFLSLLVLFAFITGYLISHRKNKKK